ncbi:MAG: acetate--CoA ligase family protein, partial [bacterium]|nr:acetate--CoA ligase family protein [bacterium]
MARLFEYQGKELLRRAGFDIPDGKICTTPNEAEAIATQLGGEVVVKAQVWVANRLSKGLIKFCKTPETAKVAAKELLGQVVNNFPIDKVLVEKKLDIDRELFAAVIIDATAGQPL